MSLRADLNTLRTSLAYTWRLRSNPTTRAERVQRGVLRLFSFLVINAIVVAGLHFAIHAGLRRITTSDFGVTNRVVNGEVNAEIVISGSSRALTHYDAEIIGKLTGRSTFNLGLNGTQTDVQVAYLRMYLRKNSRPALVVHNLDPYAFLTSHEIYDPAKYLPYLSEPEIFSTVRRVYPQAWKWRYLPLYGYAVEDLRFTWISGIKALFKLQPPQDRVLGYQARHTTWTADFDHFKAANPKGVDLGVEPQGVRDLEEIVALCREYHVPLLFVYSPEYFEMQGLERNRADLFAKFREISSQPGVEFWDYSTSPLCQERGWFYNSQHLNVGGASAFSRDLGQRLGESDVLSKPRAPTPGVAINEATPFRN